MPSRTRTAFTIIYLYKCAASRVGSDIFDDGPSAHTQYNTITYVYNVPEWDGIPFFPPCPLLCIVVPFVRTPEVSLVLLIVIVRARS